MDRQTMIDLGYLPSPLKANRMKFEIFNKQNTSTRGDKGPHVRIHAKTAHTITVRAAEIIGVDDNSCISFLKDPDTGDFYIARDDENGFPLRKTDTGSFTFNAAGLRALLLKESETSRRFPVSQTPVEADGKKLYLLINPKSSRSKPKGE